MASSREKQEDIDMYCPKCGKENTLDAKFCPDCGADLQSKVIPKGEGRPVTSNVAGTRDQQKPSELVYPRNPPLSPHLCWLNIVLQGLAQMIYGQVAKGVTILVSVLVGFAILPNLLSEGWFWIAVIAAYAFTINDAYKVGLALKMGKPVGKWDWFPDEG